jgi:hypothetical protein
MRNMISYMKAAMERAMKVQEVILRAIAKRITWWQAAEIFVNGTSLLNLDGFAPASQWETLSGALSASTAVPEVTR